MGQLIPEMDGADLADALAALDQIVTSEEEMNSAEWFLAAADRFILQAYVIRQATRAGEWAKVAEGLAMLSGWCGQYAQNALTQMPPEEVLELVRRKLETQTGQPQRFVGYQGPFAAFEPEPIEVPDRYEEP